MQRLPFVGRARTGADVVLPMRAPDIVSFCYKRYLTPLVSGGD